MGQKKRLPFVVDSSINNFKKVYVSGGRRGLEIALAPDDLVRVCKAKAATIRDV